MNISIVPIAEKHIPGFWAAIDHVSRERKYLSFLEAPPIERSRAFVLDNIKNENPQFVVLDDERVVGWCDVIREQRPVHSHCGHLGIGLLPHYRNKGIGRQLINQTIEAAWQKGFTRIVLSVYASNTTAKKLYESLGFKLEGIKHKDTRIDGVYGDSYFMALLRE